MKQLFILLFTYSQICGQTINFKGKLLDKETNKPVVYANISFLKTNTGISSSEDGTFILEINEKLLKEGIHISCLNYKDTIVLAKDLQNKTIFLKAKSYELEEIVISKKADIELVVDKYRRRHIKSGFGGRQKAPYIITKHFDYKEKYNKTPYIKEVVVYFSAMIMRKKSKFRLRLFKKDKKTGMPSNDIIKNEIIVTSRKIDGKVKVDISKFDIEFPKEGFFIGLERIHVPYNFYEYNYTMIGNKKKYIAKAVSPNFGATYTKDTIFIFSKGKWIKHYFPQKIYNGNQIQPAISVTLSN